MQKQKPLLPSLREKKRYVVFEVRSDKKISLKKVKDSINKESENFLGKLTLAKAGVVYLNDWKDQKGGLKINNKYVDHIKAVFTQLKTIGKEKVIVRSVGVSGILNKARSKYIGG